MTNGCVYLFRQKGTDYIKIGMTENETVELRFNAFKTYSPLGGEIVGVICTDRPHKIEKEIHRRYIHKRLAGEFFQLTPDECNEIIKSYETKREADLRSAFESWISNPNNDLVKLNKILRLENEKAAAIDDREKLIIDVCNTFYPDMYFTASEVKAKIQEVHNINMESNYVGTVLRKNFNRTTKRVNMIPIKVYHSKK